MEYPGPRCVCFTCVDELGSVPGADYLPNKTIPWIWRLILNLAWLAYSFLEANDPCSLFKAGSCNLTRQTTSFSETPLIGR